MCPANLNLITKYLNFGLMPAKLTPGSHSIFDVTPTYDEAAGKWRIKWRVCLANGEVKVKKASVTGNRKSGKNSVINIALEQTEELLAAPQTGNFTLDSKISDYITAISIPKVSKVNKNVETIRQYERCLTYLLEQVTNATIRDFKRFRTLEYILEQIALAHGTSSARQTQKVLGKYVFQELRRDELADGNPLHREQLELPNVTLRKSAPGGVALTAQEYDKAVKFLLNYEPETEFPITARGTPGHINTRRRVVELALLQAGTGLRISEANRVKFEDIAQLDNGHVYIEVTVDAVAKMSEDDKARLRANGVKVVRNAPVFDPRIAAKLLEWKDAAVDQTHFIIGSPYGRASEWDKSNRDKATTRLYKYIAAQTGIDKFEVIRSHSWRATLNTILAPAMSIDARARFLGHTAEVNDRFYTDMATIRAGVNHFQNLLESS